MRVLGWIAVGFLGVAPLGTGAARADSGVPTSTRLSIDGGAARVYPTYGHVTDPEFYAPVREELAALGLRFQLTGSLAEATLNGTRAANWPVTRSTAGLPVNGKPPTVLLIGRDVYLPLRACGALLGRAVAWDYGGSLLRVGTPPAAGSGAMAPAGPLQLRPGTATEAPALDPVQERAIRAASLAIAAALQGLTADGCLVAGAARGASAIARLAAAALPPPPPIRAVVRRESPVLAFRGGGAQRTPPDGIFRASRGPLLGKTICVDAGHGGSSAGARGLNGLLEKDACLAMARELARALQEAGAAVIMSREDDAYVSLDDRIDFANTRQADLFISIHCNAMPVHNTVNGTETYYDTPQSLALARAIHPQVVGAVGERDGGVRRRGFAVIRRTTMPSVLVEVAYIDHLGDEAKLVQPEFRARVGDAIRDGVVRYFQSP
jgi:N-acetylmuramoyl-L-alanine amidase